MKHQEYVQTATRAAQLVERGNYKKAIALLQELVAGDISDVDKAMMCLNLAITYDKAGRMDKALIWYRKGIDFERLHDGHFVAEKLAHYLADKGRYMESLAHYEALLSNPTLSEGDKERIEKNIATLRKRVASGPES